MNMHPLVDAGDGSDCAGVDERWSAAGRWRLGSAVAGWAIASTICGAPLLELWQSPFIKTAVTFL